MRAALEFDPRDLWIGLFWKRERVCTVRLYGVRWDVYVCLIPCFPLHIWWFREIKLGKRKEH